MNPYEIIIKRVNYEINLLACLVKCKNMVNEICKKRKWKIIFNISNEIFNWARWYASLWFYIEGSHQIILKIRVSLN